MGNRPIIYGEERVITIPPDFVALMLDNPLTGDLFIKSMGHIAHTPYHRVNRPNGTPDYVLLYCQIGKGYIRVDKHEYVLQANQFIILPARIAHYYRADAQNPWNLYWINFSGTKAPLFAASLQNPTDIDVASNSRIEERNALFEEMYNGLYKSIDLNTLDYVNGTLFYYLSTLRYMEHFRSVKKEKQHQDSMVSEVKHFMNENLENKLSIEQMASYVGYSPSFFYRKFIKEMGTSPMHYFTQIKMNAAAIMLIKTDLKIAQIAQKVGYQDYFYFIRVFTKTFNISPDKFKRLNFRL